MKNKIRKLFLTFIPILSKSYFIKKIPALYDWLEIRPSSAVIFLTNRCNLKCIMCKQWKEAHREELSTDDWKRIIQELKVQGVRNIHFTGGEPLLRHDLCELICFSAKQNGLVAGITTNGLLLDDKMLVNLKKAGLRSIAVSVDALNGKYEEIRNVPNSFGKVKKAVSLISDMKKKREIDAYINYTLMNNTIDEFKNVKKLAEKFELPVAINLLDKSSYIFDIEENRDKYWIADDEDFKKLQYLLNYLRDELTTKPSSLILNFPAINFIAAYFKDPVQKKLPCISSQDRICIDPYGNLLGGCLSMGSFGNISKVPFRELINAEKYKTAKINMFFKNCLGCSCGYIFNTQHFLPYLVKNFQGRLKSFLNEKCLNKN